MRRNDFVPPIVSDLVRRLRTREKLYASFHAARAACCDAYEDDSLVSVVYEKILRYKESIFRQQPFVCDTASTRTLIAVCLAARHDTVSVVDFGGACGTHYFVAKRILASHMNLKWHVVETSKMAARGRALEDGNLRFFDDLAVATEGLERVDLLLSSGALQYVPDPYRVLNAFVAARAEHIFLTRLGLSTTGQDVVTIQRSMLSSNGPGPLPPGMCDGHAQYPITFLRKEKVEQALAAAYSIEIQFDEDRHAYRVGDLSIDMYGYFGRRLPL